MRVRVSREAARHGEHALRLWLLNAAPKKEPQKEIGTSLKGEKNMTGNLVVALFTIATLAAGLGYSTAAWAAGCCGLCG